MKEITESMNEIIFGLGEMSTGTVEITESISSLRGLSSEVHDSSLVIADQSEIIEEGIKEITNLSEENTRAIGEIRVGLKEISNAMTTVTLLGQENTENLAVMENHIRNFTIIDTSPLRSSDNQPLIQWNRKEPVIPPRPADPAAFPEEDARHWYDMEYAGWGIQKINIPTSSAEGASGKRVIAIIPGPHPYYDAYQRGMRSIASAFNVTVDIRIGEKWLAEEQHQMTMKALREKPDLLINCPGDSESSTRWIKAASEAGIPVVISTAQPAREGYPYILAFTGFDDWGSHRVLARDMAERMNFKGNYCLIRHATGSSQYYARTWGFITEQIKTAPDMKCFEALSTELDRDRTRETVSGWLKKYGESLNALMICDSHNPLIGAMEALTAAGRKDIIVYATGNNRVSLDYMKKGLVHGIRWESAEADGAIALETAVDWFNGLEVQPIRYLPAKVIRPEDVDQYYPPQW